jgi:soluble lytic murein transglycosylase-like protein
MSDFNPLIKTCAEKYALDPAIVFGICMKESSMEQFAVRYEPAWKWFVNHPPGQPRNCSDATERVLQATSFGIMQVMGAVFREYGFKGWLTMVLAFPEMQLEYGCRHLAGKVKRFGLNGGISSYNAGSPVAWNQEYVDGVIGFSQEWQA